MEKINENIFRYVIPYKDIYTTLYAIKTDGGYVLFDSASYDEDIDAYVVPFLNELNITQDNLKYVFISHDHTDHSGGLKAFMQKYPKTCIVSRSPALTERFNGYNTLLPQENTVILNHLKIVTIIGHTADSSGILDMRTNTLISGDGLQLYGIFGSGKWGSNIYFPDTHIHEVNKLKQMEINHILTAHDYEPYGYSYVGKEAVLKALDACIEPLYKVRDMIINNPTLSDEEICALYNKEKTPTLGEHVVTQVRKKLL